MKIKDIPISCIHEYGNNPRNNEKAVDAVAFKSAEDRGAAPCKDCAERRRGCHGECERYAEFVRECEELRRGRERRLIVAGYGRESRGRYMRRREKR